MFQSIPNAEFFGLALLLLLALAALFAVSLPPAWNPVRVFRRKLAVLALAGSIALAPAPAFAQGYVPRSDSGDGAETVLIIAGIALVVAIIVIAASKESESAFDDSAGEIPDDAETPVSLGSFRLSERGESTHYGATVATVSPTAAQNGMPARMRRASASGLFGALARLPENALAKANASSRAQSGWSVRPALDAAGLRDPDDARFFLQVERAF